MDAFLYENGEATPTTAILDGDPGWAKYMWSLGNVTTGPKKTWGPMTMVMLHAHWVNDRTSEWAAPEGAPEYVLHASLLGGPDTEYQCKTLLDVVSLMNRLRSAIGWNAPEHEARRIVDAERERLKQVMAELKAGRTTDRD